MVAAVDPERRRRLERAQRPVRAAVRQRGTPSTFHARVSAEIAVACVMPLIHGAVPPPQSK